MAGATDDLLRDVALEGVREAKILVPRRTGNLGRTIRIGRIQSDAVEVVAGGQRSVGYAAAVELGTGPHRIVPRRRKVLAWGGNRTLGGRLRKGAKATTFARRVNHPGTRARPYLVPGLKRALEKVGIGRLVEAWNRAD